MKLKIFLATAAALLAQNAWAWGAVWELSHEKDAKEWIRKDTSKIFSATYKGLFTPLRQGVVVNEESRDAAVRKAMKICKNAKRWFNGRNTERGGAEKGRHLEHCKVEHVFRKECVALATLHRGYRSKEGTNSFLRSLGETRKFYTSTHIEQFWSGQSKATKWFRGEVKRKANAWCDKPRPLYQVPAHHSAVFECHIKAECDWWWGDS